LVDTGTYSVAALTIPVNVILKGVSANSTIITTSSLAWSGVAMLDLTLTTTQSLATSADLTLNNVVLNGSLVQSGGKLIIDDSRIQSGSDGLTLAGGSEAEVTGSAINSTSGSAITISGTVTSHISNNLLVSSAAQPAVNLTTAAGSTATFQGNQIVSQNGTLAVSDNTSALNVLFANNAITGTGNFGAASQAYCAYNVNATGSPWSAATGYNNGACTTSTLKRKQHA
jgi:hypothetical protein